MTCIVGLVDEGKVYMGADSAGVSGSDLRVRKDPKVFRNGDFLIGFTSSFRMGQLLRYGLEVPVATRGSYIDTYEFMVREFVTAVRTCLKGGGCASKRDEVESGGQFLVGYEGRLFDIEEDYQVAEYVTPYAAVGDGVNYALGSLYSTSGMGYRASDRLKTALNAAEEFCSSIRRPFVVMGGNHG